MFSRSFFALLALGAALPATAQNAPAPVAPPVPAPAAPVASPLGADWSRDDAQELLAYRSYGGARTYFRAVAIIYGLLTVLGLLPATNTTFGLVPIYGNDVWLHALLALVAAYFGWVNRDTAGGHA